MTSENGLPAARVEEAGGKGLGCFVYAESVRTRDARTRERATTGRAAHKGGGDAMA
jgi:hypothetical protein